MSTNLLCELRLIEADFAQKITSVYPPHPVALSNRLLLGAGDKMRNKKRTIQKMHRRHVPCPNASTTYHCEFSHCPDQECYGFVGKCPFRGMDPDNWWENWGKYEQDKTKIHE